MYEKSVHRARLISPRWFVSSFGYCHQPRGSREGSERATRTNWFRRFIFHAGPSPRENKPPPRSPAECHSQCVSLSPHNARHFGKSLRWFQSTGFRGRRALPRCRSLKLLFARVLVELGG